MSDNQETGPQTIDEILDVKFAEPDEPTAIEEEATPDVVEDQADEPETDEEEVKAEDAEEDTEEQDDPEQSPEEPQHLDLDEYGELTIPIIVDGEERKVNLAEAAKGYQLQADYSRKTAALAQERKQIDAQIEQERAALADKQRLLDEQLLQMVEPEPDWIEMAQKDPAGYIAKKAEWDQKAQKAQDAQVRLQEQQEQQRVEFMQKTAEYAVSVMPEWADNDKFAEGAQKRLKAAIDAGFTEDEYNSSVDFRLAVLLEKASRYDEMQTKGAAVGKKLAKSPKVLKPSASKGKADVKVERKAAVKRKLTKPHSVEEHLDALFGG